MNDPLWNLIFAATVLAVASSSIAAESRSLFPISIEGKWGYIDEEGTVVIEPTFLSARHFSEGLAVVSVAGTTEEDRVFDRVYEGFIDSNANFVIPPKPPGDVAEISGFEKYSYYDFQDGMAQVHINHASGVDGFINRKGELVIKPQFCSAEGFSEGLAFVSSHVAPFMKSSVGKDQLSQQTAGFINKQGQFSVKNRAIWDSSGFTGGHAIVSVDSENDTGVGLIDRTGRFVIQPGVYTSLENSAGNTFLAVKGGKVGLLDADGKIIVAFGKYDQITQPSDGSVFVAELNGKTVLIDSSGKQCATVSENGDVGPFRNGFATLRRDGLVGYIDSNGDTIIPIMFEQAGDFRNGLSLVTKGKTKGYIDPKGKFVWKTDKWNEPVRNALAKPLTDFLPKPMIEALPLSYNWEGVNNAIVFVVDGNLEQLRALYKQKCKEGIELCDDTDFKNEPGKIELTISTPNVPFIEVFAVAGNAELADGFVSFYSCDNMDLLRKKHPNKIIGIVIEN